MQTPAAVDNVFRSLKPGARVVATGLKSGPMVVAGRQPLRPCRGDALDHYDGRP